MMKSQVTIRKFRFDDIPQKIKWINDPNNNQYLHYDLPLEYEKTCHWFEGVQTRTDRYDAVIEVNAVPVGLIGLLNICSGRAEYYITMGESSFKRQGVAYRASMLLLRYAFDRLCLEQVYLYTEVDNLPGQRLFEKVGFLRGEQTIPLCFHGRERQRYLFFMTKERFFCLDPATPIQELGTFCQNHLWVKRDDLLPYCFGGNKARKAELFFQEIDAGDYDCVVTYGSSHSNHCRVVANLAAERQIPCWIVAPEEVSDHTFNSRLDQFFGAKIRVVPVDMVHQTLEDIQNQLKAGGRKPYFIPGGGHGNLGTEAYVRCYEEIRRFERLHHCFFDYIFFPSGTGTTQAGLVCGQMIHQDSRSVIGISIARKNPRGREVVLQSVKDYLQAHSVETSEQEIARLTVFVDDFTGPGYGRDCAAVTDTIQTALIRYGLPLDETYTGKAFFGMEQYLRQHNLKDKNILFIHTGGTPLFFDALIQFDMAGDVQER